MSGKYIVSTLTADQRYTVWNAGKDIPVPLRSVSIAGGANRAPKTLVTPAGVCTPVTDEEYATLEQVSAFKRHVEAGYIRVLDRNPIADEVAKDMTPKDGSAPLTDEDFKEGKEPTAGKAEPEETPQPTITKRTRKPRKTE